MKPVGVNIQTIDPRIYQQQADPNMVYGILYTEGEIDMEAIQEECYRQRWCPLMGLEPRSGEGPSILLCVKDVEVGIAFIKKNLPAGWIPGMIKLPWQEVAHAKQIGWQIDVMTYPRKVMNHPTHKVTSLIHNFQEPPTYHECRRRVQAPTGVVPVPATEPR